MQQEPSWKEDSSSRVSRIREIRALKRRRHDSDCLGVPKFKPYSGQRDAVRWKNSESGRYDVPPWKWARLRSRQ
jgi:hypothetical protein